MSMICRNNFNITVALDESNCQGCPHFRKEKEKFHNIYSFKDIIPKDLCAHAYYSMIPYWVSFQEGAEFAWRKDLNDVNVQCIQPEGINFDVIKAKEGDQIKVRAKVVGKGSFSCPNKHDVSNAVFNLDSPFCPGIFASFWANVALKEQKPKTFNLTCSVKSIKVPMTLL